MFCSSKRLSRTIFSPNRSWFVPLSFVVLVPFSFLCYSALYPLVIWYSINPVIIIALEVVGSNPARVTCEVFQTLGKHWVCSAIHTSVLGKIKSVIIALINQQRHFYMAIPNIYVGHMLCDTSVWQRFPGGQGLWVNLDWCVDKWNIQES